jgi:hypothetical protein
LPSCAAIPDGYDLSGLRDIAAEFAVAPLLLGAQSAGSFVFHPALVEAHFSGAPTHPCKGGLGLKTP